MTLPKGWTERTVADLSSLVTSGSRGWAKYHAESGSKFIKIQNICRGRLKLDLSDLQYVSLPNDVEGTRTRLQDDDIVLTITADLGRVGLIDKDFGDAYVNQHVALIRPTSPVNPAYLAWFIMSASAQKQFGLLDRGVTRSGLSLENVENLRVPTPPVAEQRRIVAKLDALTARLARARAELEQVSSLVSSVRKAALRHLWTGANITRLENLLAEPVRNGLSISGSDQPPGVRSLKLSALRSATVDLTDTRYLPITKERAQPYALMPGDILISRGNGSMALVGKASLVVAEAEAQLPIFPDTAFRVRLSVGRVYPRWFTYVWNSPEMRQQIEHAARTTAGIWKIAQRDLQYFRLPATAFAEQGAQLQQLDAAFAHADRLEAEAARARALLDRLEAAILARAFRGELVPQDPNDEPASVLLDRIRAERAAAPAPKRGRRAKPVGA